ncbi:MarR family winged helix-turn-helix transcriptional regulator [Paenibacillus rigui]|uniref:MarR family transcriptional regulator n=1 Tax=Paenibacillus rigui TaxID=554312 RepID=A0A229UHJ3_9BACL|nr:MarR family transcriptional regulator [Paenibacillus rigui]OXM82888.1 MarR family transcriptional regulator [Paenibacillus rigui]
MDKLSEKELTAWRLFIKAHAKIIEFIERDLAAQKKVPLTTYDVLIALFEAPDRRLRFSELNRKVVLSKSGLTRMIDRLEREGLIQREKSEEDRRGAYAVLTDEGENQLRKAWPIYARGIKQYFAASLSDEEVEILTRSLGLIYNELQSSQEKEGKES